MALARCQGPDPEVHQPHVLASCHDRAPRLLHGADQGQANASGARDQDVYLKALRAAGSADWIELGKYIEKAMSAPLATRDAKNRPVVQRAAWPVMLKDASGSDVPGATFMPSVVYREEKGSDVNVASHLLVDVLSGAVDAGIVISNDSDLFPIKEARRRVPIGTVNPSSNRLAGDLKGNPTAGAGRHWWRQLSASDVTSSQLPNPAGGFHRPPGW